MNVGMFFKVTICHTAQSTSKTAAIADRSCSVALKNSFEEISKTLCS